MIRRVGLGLAWIFGVAVLTVGVWMLAIGPVAVFRVITNGTTTVWDHSRYPGREISASPQPQPWATAPLDLSAVPIVIGSETRSLDAVLQSTPTLAFVVVDRGRLVYEWYAEGHDPGTPVMSFSVTKSILGLLIGAAIDDGLIGSVTDPVSDYLPEMASGGLDRVTIEQLLTMDSGLDYVEDDNPFGKHVEFNYTPDLAAATLALRVGSHPDDFFRYKSGDYAILGLILDRILGETSITGYLQERLWDPLGAMDAGMWSTDAAGGLERAWCCFATSARDLARVGQLVVDKGVWGGRQLLPVEWIDAALESAYRLSEWPVEYSDSVFTGYGYGWWEMAGGAWAGQGKGGQYLYLLPDRGLVVVRQGEASGGVSWGSVIPQALYAIP